MLDDEVRSVLRAARVGRLATADAEGLPHVVPVCFALLEGDGGATAVTAKPTLVTPIDEKPKAAGPADLRRVRDVRANPRVAVVVDRYDEDWDRLGWLLLRGTARVLEPGAEGHPAAVGALRARYDQYADHALEERPVIAIAVGSVTTWGDLSGLRGEP